MYLCEYTSGLFSPNSLANFLGLLQNTNYMKEQTLENVITWSVRANWLIWKQNPSYFVLKYEEIKIFLGHKSFANFRLGFPLYTVLFVYQHSSDMFHCL